MSTLSTHTSRAIRNKSMAALYGIAADYDCDLSDVISVIDAALGLKRTTTQVVSYTGRDGVTKSIETTVSEPPPSQPEVPSHAPAADTPATQAAGETTDGGSFPSSLAGDLPSVAPSPEPQPAPSAVQADAAPPRDVTSPAESDAAEISAPIISRKNVEGGKPKPLPRRYGMQTKFLEAHAAHPDWSDVQLAEHLGCNDAYIRRVANRYGIKLASRFGAKRAKTTAKLIEETSAAAPKPRINVRNAVFELFAANRDITAAEAIQQLGATPATVKAALSQARSQARAEAAASAPPPPPTPQMPVAPPPPTTGTLTDRVRIMHEQHPNWTARMIANELGAPVASVQTLLTVARKAVPQPADAHKFTSRLEMIRHYGDVAKRLGRS